MPDNVYDAVRYSNNPYAQTHPERLATVAILHGLAPPDPFHARVLEIGCGAGGNLMAMAAATPGIRATGVDLAAEPIAEGQRAIAEIGLGNIELRQGDLRDLADGSLGEFDYIVAHGVYSWIPRTRATRCWPRSARAWRPTASPTCPSTPIPAATSGGCCATSGSGTPARSTASDPADARGQGAGALQVPRRAPHDERRHLRGAARARGPAARRRADLPARPRRPRRPLASGLVRRVRRARRRARADLPRRGRPLRPARREPARGRGARAVAARRRRPGRVRELHRPADRAPLPPEPALPRRAADRDRAGRRSARSGCTGRSACRPSRSRSASSPTSSPSSTRAARARSASPSCRSVWARTRRRWARRCSTASGASA